MLEDDRICLAVVVEMPLAPTSFGFEKNVTLSEFSLYNGRLKVAVDPPTNTYYDISGQPELHIAGICIAGCFW